jgi:hypothetical protein
VAARRWLDRLRGEARREWQAEAGELLRQGRPARAIGFALSLAGRRARMDQGGAGGYARTAGPVVGTALVVSLGPVLGVFLGFIGALSWVLLLVAVGITATMSFVAGHVTVLRRPAPTVVLVLTPATAVLILMAPLAYSGPEVMDRTTLLWAAVMLPVLSLAARGGRSGLAVGGAGLVAAAWAATTLAMWSRNARGFLTQDSLPAVFHLDPSYAPWWFPASLLGFNVGPVPDETGSWWLLVDHLEMYPQSLLVVGVHAVAYVTGATVRRMDEASPPRSTAPRSAVRGASR